MSKSIYGNNIPPW